MHWSTRKNGVVSITYIFKSVFAELHHEVEKDQGREPQTPHDHLLHRLHVQDAKNEDELVEDEVPEFILQVLRNKHRRTEGLITPGMEGAALF